MVSCEGRPQMEFRCCLRKGSFTDQVHSPRLMALTEKAHILALDSGIFI